MAIHGDDTNNTGKTITTILDNNGYTDYIVYGSCPTGNLCSIHADGEATALAIISDVIYQLAKYNRKDPVKYAKDIAEVMEEAEDYYNEIHTKKKKAIKITVEDAE